MAYEQQGPHERSSDRHPDEEVREHEHDDDGYSGAAMLVLDDEERSVEVRLRGHFQPIDGRYHWYGRLGADAELVNSLGGKRGSVLIRTPQGEARGELSDPDPWDRYRITGTSTPPFAVDC
ncbi:DUF4873 domain-containing protein [Streptomyces monticola]|uniref:DUF4873 domain-containing protein n=1 Tax=Streptomyces monticola TaxID=2666263 RepID=A0ABW2JGS2_9ACTN